MTDAPSARDSLSVALDAINDRWSLHIVRALAFGASRYTDILRAVGAPRDVLASRLRSLAQAGIIESKEVQGKARPGYSLTAKGIDLAQVILVLKKWGDLYKDENTPSVTFTHAPCGQPFVAEVHCTACGQALRRGELTAPHDGHE